MYRLLSSNWTRNGAENKFRILEDFFSSKQKTIIRVVEDSKLIENKKNMRNCNWQITYSSKRKDRKLLVYLCMDIPTDEQFAIKINW